MSRAGIKTNPKKIEKVKNWPRPKTVTELWGFLGLCNYYKKFIEGFSQKVRPLYKLLMGMDTKALKKKGGNLKLDWTDENTECFELLKEICTNTLILAYADYSKHFKVHRDASEIGLGPFCTKIKVMAHAG